MAPGGTPLDQGTRTVWPSRSAKVLGRTRPDQPQFPGCPPIDTSGRAEFGAVRQRSPGTRVLLAGQVLGSGSALVDPETPATMATPLRQTRSPPARGGFGPPMTSPADVAGVPVAPIRSQVRDAVERAWRRAVESGALPAATGDGPAAGDDRPPVEIERPAKPEHGDLATNLAMKLARPYRRAPLEIARALAAEIATRGRRSGRRLADRGRRGRAARLPQPAPRGPGARGDDRRRPRRTRPAGVASPPVRPRKVNVEFVSANPTGPLTIGNARGAFIGDLLCRVLEAGGQDVTREYYFNDSGGADRPTSARRSSRSGAASRSPRTATTATTSTTSRPTCPTTSGRRRRAGRRRGRRSSAAGRPRRVRAGIEASLERLGVHFDVWTTRGARSTPTAGSSGRSSGSRAGGHVYEQDGALWFRSTAFGDDKDRVIIRVRRPADLLRRRHRLRHREVQPRLRPPDLHLGRRPSRDGGPGPQRRRRRWATTRTPSRCCSTRGSASSATASRSR